MGIAVKDPLEIYVDREKIILSKYEPFCIFCSQADEVKYIKDKTVCVHCINELKNIKNTPAGVFLMFYCKLSYQYKRVPGTPAA